jgi:hypothetical protein
MKPEIVERTNLTAIAEPEVAAPETERLGYCGVVGEFFEYIAGTGGRCPLCLARDCSGSRR